ncbi:MAG: TRAFs-binding domain-containing protein [Bacteroidota bacterium]
MRPLCFVLMPFGTKRDASEKEINFDIVYHTFIRPAIEQAGLDPIRADEEQAGGFIHKPMYERLMFCNFAVADLSFANANVFYELGIRHALKPHTTVSIFETGTKLPFDTAPLRTFNYDFKDNTVLQAQQKIDALANLIKANLNTTQEQQDSPIAQLIPGYHFPDLDYLQADADAFKEWAVSHRSIKKELRELEKKWKGLNKLKDRAADAAEKEQLTTQQKAIVDAIRQEQVGMGDALLYSYDIIYALLNAYKTVNAFKEMADMLRPLVESTFEDNIFIKQQLALAYNKIGERTESERVLKSIIKKYGPDPETNGLLGAAYKGMMDDNKGEIEEAGFRSKAITAYLDGFEADPRDYYPGINALTLMFYGNAKKDKAVFDKYLPLVQFAVDRQLKKKSDDYWLQATRMELAILSDDCDLATEALSDLLACNPEQWARSSTKANISKLFEKKSTMENASSCDWIKLIVNKL